MAGKLKKKICRTLTPGSLYSSTKGMAPLEVIFSSLLSDSVEFDFSMMFFIGNSLRETDEDEIEGDPDGDKSIVFVGKEYI